MDGSQKKLEVGGGGWEGVRDLVYILSATESYNKYLSFSVRFVFILQ